MKKTICLILIFLLSLSSVSSYAESLTFPQKLTPGKYNIEVPKDDEWTVFNQQSLFNFKKAFAEEKLNAELSQKLHDEQIKYLTKSYDNEIEHINKLNSIDITACEKKLDILEKQLDNGTFLGIPKTTLYFLGGMIFALSSVYVSNRSQ